MRRLWALGLGSVLLAGCVDLAPQYKVPLVAVPASYRDTQIWRTAAAPDTANIPADWWTGFSDPVLTKLEDQLNKQNFTLAAAVAIYEQERANAAEAEAGLFPWFGVQGDISRTKYPADGILKAHDLPPAWLRNTLDGSLTYEVDFWDQIHNQVRAGKAMAQASAADLAFIRLSLEAELANDYMLLRGLDAFENLYEQTVIAYQQALDVAQNRFSGMVSSGMDVARAKAQLDTVRGELQDVLARRAVAVDAIATLVAVPAPAFSIPPSLAPVHLPVLPPSMPSTLLQRRPDIASSERQVAAANAMIGVARAAFFPNISINLLAGFQNASTAMFNVPSTFWSLGPGLTLPVFEGGLLQAQEAATIAAFNQVVAQYRNNVLTAFQEMGDALAQLRYFAAEQAAYQRAVKAAQDTLDMSMALYKDGATNYLEVVVAQEQLLTSQQALLDIQTRYAQSGVRLVRALGGGWGEHDLPQPDAVPLHHVQMAE